MTKAIAKKKFASPADSRDYAGLLADVKRRIRAAQVRTAMAGNASMLLLYWEIGGVLAERQKKEGWGAAVLPRLAADLHNELPEVKGFSERNLKRMVQFFREYPSLFAIGPRAVAQLAQPPPNSAKGPPSVAQSSAAASGDAQMRQRAVAQLTWAHNLFQSP